MSNQIAQTILSQLGGNKFIAMTGATNLGAGENYLTMKLKRNASKANHLRITLNSMDTYDVQFIKVTGPSKRNNYNSSVVTVKEVNGVYNDMLQETFTAETGMYTSL